MKRSLATIALLVLGIQPAQGGILGPPVQLASRFTQWYVDEDGPGVRQEIDFLEPGEAFEIADLKDPRVNIGTYNDAIVAFSLAGVSLTEPIMLRILVDYGLISSGFPLESWPVGMRFTGGTGSIAPDDFPETHVEFPGFDAPLGSFPSPMPVDIDVTDEVRRLVSEGYGFMNVYLNTISDHSVGMVDFRFSIYAVPEPPSVAMFSGTIAALGIAKFRRRLRS